MILHYFFLFLKKKLNHFRSNSTLIHTGQKVLNFQTNTAYPHNNKIPIQPKRDHLLLIENMQTKGSIHQFEKKKQTE